MIDVLGKLYQHEQPKILNGHEDGLTRREFEHDSFLENEILLCLSKLEHTQTQIKSGKVKKPSAVLEMLVEMANKVLDFFDKTVSPRSDAVNLQNELSGQMSRYSVARWIQTADGRYSSKSAGEVLKRAESSEQFQVFADLCLSMIVAMDSAFKVLVTCFFSKTSAKEISEAYNLYLHDLNATIGEIRI